MHTPKEYILCEVMGVNEENFFGVFDITEIQSLLDSFYDVTNIPLSIIDKDGIILVKSGWREVCTVYHRTNPSTLKRCQESNDKVSERIKKGETYIIYQCKNGLVEIWIPIIINDHHFATVVAGQFLFNKPDMDYFKGQAEMFGFDIKDYLSKIQKVPVIHQDKVKSIMSFLLQITGIIAQLVYKNIQLREIQRQLSISEERYRLAVEGANDGLWDWDLITDTGYISDKWKELLGFKNNEIHHHFKTWANIIHPKDRILAIERLHQHFEGLTPYYQSEYRVKIKSGEYVWISSRGRALRNESGRPIRMVGSYTDISEQKKVQQQVHRMAYYDSLTGLPNRILFFNTLKQELEKSKQNGQKGALFFVDLDNFKTINDTIGHAFGDELLKTVAKMIQASIGQSAMAARIGGDEFIILSPNVANMVEVVDIARKLLSILNGTWRVKEYEFYLTASIGITVYPTDGNSADQLLKNADMAMYAAKEKGKNSYQFFDKAMSQRILEKAAMEKSLRYAIKNNELDVYYQPMLDVKTGKVVEIEALLRWKHPQKGLLSPFDFIPIAEETGLIIPIGEWVLRTACRQNKIWEQNGYFPCSIAVNISAVQLQNRDFVETVKKVLHDTGLAPGLLQLEITESTLMKSIDSTINILNDLRRIGVKISLDDFGTGYSSLNYLKRLPINTLKIDKTFVDDIQGESDDKAITGAIIALAHRMRLDVTAEGVETKEQLKCLTSQQCDKVQGFLLCKPCPAEELEELIKYGRFDFK